MLLCRGKKKTYVSRRISQMKKKLILPIAATAALLFTSTGALEADAANVDTQVQKRVYVYQSGDLNKEQLNTFLQKYFQNFKIYGDSFTVNKPAENTTQEEKTESPQPAPVPKEEQTSQPAPTQQQPTVPSSTEQPAPAAKEVSAYEQKVVELTNQERAKQGLPALKLDTELSKVARAKSQDMQSKGYFSHTSPTYGSPFDMMKQFGISYRAAGENIAMGQRTPEEVVKAWMNSEGHRANILNGSFTHIGVGYVESGNYWTQMFIGK